MKKRCLACLVALVAASPAYAEVSFEGYGWFGARYDGGSDQLSATSRLRFTIDGETEASNGMEFSFRMRLQTEEGATSQFNGARFGLKYGPLRLRVGNIAGAIDALPALYGAEPGLTDLTNQASALRAGFDTYDNQGRGRNGIALRYSASPLEAMLSHSRRDGMERTAAYVAYSSGQSTFALGIQASNIAKDDKLAVLVYNQAFGAGEISLLAAREQAGHVFGASAKWDVTASTDLLVSAAASSQGAAEKHFGIGLVHDLGGGVSLEAGIATNRGVRSADFGVRFEF